MESANELISEIISIKDKYDSLKNKYNEFIAQILAVKKVDARLASIEIIDNENNSITIKYLDRELKAYFSFFINDEDEQKGHINCVKRIQNQDADPIKIHHFNFNGQGLTDIPTKKESDPYEIHNRVDAINILFHWVRLSVNKNS